MSQFDSAAFLAGDSGPTERAGGETSTERAGQRIGPYTLLSVIAEGGFGVVWLAERRHPFEQRVAIKVVKQGMDSKEVLARFERERRALAILDHPGIARVIDGGPMENGRPYFVMEYVDGKPITTFCDIRRMSQRERLRLFADVCRTVHAAHTKGVIHRDLKPANILVELTSQPGESPRSPKLERRVGGAVATGGPAPWPRVIDFGMAKVIGQQSSQFARTEMVMFVGTLEYMSPEQAMSETDIDTRSDVYSLGVVLYELLTGALPLPSESLRGVPLEQARSLVARGVTRRPSEALRALPAAAARAAAGARGVSIAEMHSGLRRELELIPLTAMHADRERRYQSALQLAEDVERYLAGLPLVAAPDTTWYRLRKTVQRNKLATVAVAGLVTALTAGLVTTNMFREATAEALGRTEEALSRATEAEAAAKAAAAATAAALRRSEEALYASNINAAAPLLRSGSPIAAISRLERCTDEEKKRWEWQLLKNMSDPSLITVRPLDRRPVGTIAMSPAGDLAFVGDADGNSVLLDALTCRVLVRLPSEKGKVVSCSFSRDGRWMALGYSKGAVSLISVASALGDTAGERVAGEQSHTFGSVRARWSEASSSPEAQSGGRAGAPVKAQLGELVLPLFSQFDSAGGRLLIAGGSGEVRVLRVPELTLSMEAKVGTAGLKAAGFSSADREVLTLDQLGVLTSLDAQSAKQLSGITTGGQQQRVMMAARDDVSQRWIIGRDKGECALWDPAGGATMLPPHNGATRRVAFSPDGQFAVTAGMDNLTRVFEASTGKQLASFGDSGGAPTDLVFSPDVPRFAVGSADGAVRVYSTEDFTLVMTLTGHTAEVLAAAFVPGTPLLLTASKDGSCKLWNTKPCAEKIETAKSESRALPWTAFAKNRLLVGTAAGQVERWDTATPKFLESGKAHDSGITAILALRDERLFTGGADAFLRLWKELDAPLVSIKLGGSPVMRMALSRSGDRVAMVRKGGTIGMVTISGQSVIQSTTVFDRGESSLTGPVAFGLDDSVIAVATNSGGLLVFDAASGQLKATIPAHKKAIRALAVSPDGRLIATAGDDRVIQLLDLKTYQRAAELSGHTDTVWSLEWLPKANRLLSGGKDSTVRVWDPQLGQELCIATTVTGSALDIAVSEDERMVAVTTEYGVRLLCADSIGSRLADVVMQSKSLAPVTKLLRDGPATQWTMPMRSRIAGVAAAGAPMDQAFLAISLRAGGWLDRPAISGIGITGLYRLTAPPAPPPSGADTPETGDEAR